MGTKEVLKLYKSLLRESQNFAAYNFRQYALRKVRDSFKEGKTLTDKEEIRNKISEAHRNLEVIKRQVLISQMYKTDKLVIENMKK